MIEVGSTTEQEKLEPTVAKQRSPLISRRSVRLRWTIALLLAVTLAGATLLVRPADKSEAAEAPVWVNSLTYGSAGGGFYWDFTSGTVWTGERGWHLYSPQSGDKSATLWVNYLTYGSAGGGFYLDPLSGQVWTSERGWHLFSPAASAPAPSPTATQTAGPVPLQIRQIDTRPGVTMRFVIVIPANAKDTLIMFGGANGANMFSGSGTNVRLGGNFLVATTPAYVQQGFAVAIVDVPSDQPGGISPLFRTSAAHAQDISKLIDYLDSQGLKSVYLVGTSYGTISAAYLGSALSDTRIKGVILTTTATAAPHFGEIAVNRITVPVLLVHHREDACPDTPVSGDLPLIKKLTGSPRVDFVQVSGGSPPQAGPCDPQSPHGFFGVEAIVVQAIGDWVTGKPVPPTIGP